MTLQNYKMKNNAVGTLTAGISAGATALILTAGQGALFPSTFPFFLTIEQYDTSLRVIKREIVKCTNRVTDTFTIARGAAACPSDYTATTQTATAFSFLAGDTVSLRLISDIIDDLNAELVRLETAKLNISDFQNGTKIYGASSAGTDAYAITPNPAIGAYASGQVFKILVDVGNTGPATLNVNGLGAKTIKKLHDQDLATGDIEAGQIITVSYDGTNFQMDSQVATLPSIDIEGLTEDTTPSGTEYYIRSKSGSQQKVYGKNIGKYTSITAGEDLTAMDSVYISAADTVKKLYPSAMGTGAAITTAPSHNGPCKVFQISNNVQLQITGNDGGAGGASLYAQVRTLNAAETDFTYGSEQTIYGSPSNYFDACQIDTLTWIVVFQKNTAGSPAGMCAVVLTVSGTTVTVGSITTLETTGSLSWRPTVAKVDTLKALVTYMKDSDSKPYVQVLTVSGTTITTNTAVNVKNTTNILKCCSVQLSTNTVLLCYGEQSSNIFCRTITVSGTTPTVNAEQTISTSTTSYTALEVAYISATKCIFWYGKSGVEEFICTLSISGSTVTKGTGLATLFGSNGVYLGLCMIGTGYCMMYGNYSATSKQAQVFSIVGTTVTLAYEQNFTVSSETYQSSTCCKISPWTYLVSGTAGNSDYIIKMTPASTRIGIVESSIANTVAGAFVARYKTAVLSSLTAGSIYYVDDNAQPTLNYSLTAPTLGIAINTNSLLLQ